MYQLLVHQPVHQCERYALDTNKIQYSDSTKVCYNENYSHDNLVSVKSNQYIWHVRDLGLSTGRDKKILNICKTTYKINS